MSESQPQRRYVITVRDGVQVDVTALPPLTLGDRRALKQLGVDFAKYARERIMEPEDEAQLVLYLLQKRRPETTLDEVYGLPALVSTSFLQYYMHLSAEVDDPFATRSSSSPPLTAGRDGTS